jgi:hypothetical protein
MKGVDVLYYYTDVTGERKLKVWPRNEQNSHSPNTFAA